MTAFCAFVMLFNPVSSVTFTDTHLGSHWGPLCCAQPPPPCESVPPAPASQFTATIATRGSCDALTLTLLLAMLYHLLWGRPIRGGLFYGAAVHLRIYPVIYALPLLVFLHHEHYPFLRKPSELTSVWQTAIVRFFVAAAAAFCALGGASYAFYGDEFVEHVRLTRRDAARPP